MLVTVDNDGEVDTHITGHTGDYATLCGLDGDDSEMAVNQKTLDKTGLRVTCWTCKKMWEHCQKFPAELIE